jgi:hypothetical protein
MEGKEFILHLGKAPKKGNNRYQGRPIIEDAINYNPTFVGRKQQGKTMWTHCFLYDLASGRWIMRKSMPVGKILDSYSTVTRMYYAVRREGRTIKVGATFDL